MGMGQPLYDWIKAALGGAPVSKDGTAALVNASDKAAAYRHLARPNRTKNRQQEHSSARGARHATNTTSRRRDR